MNNLNPFNYNKIMATQQQRGRKRSKVRPWVPLVILVFQLSLIATSTYLLLVYASWQVALGIFLFIWANNIMLKQNNKQ